MSQATEPTVSFSLTCKSAAAALEFYAKALGAVELFRISTPNGGVGHAEFMIGNTRINISDEAPYAHALAMPEGTRASCLFAVITQNCDESFAIAVAAGAVPLSPPTDQFWGDRSSMILDPFGYRWALNQHIEDVAPEEMLRRAQALSSEQ